MLHLLHSNEHANTNYVYKQMIASLQAGCAGTSTVPNFLPGYILVHASG